MKVIKTEHYGRVKRVDAGEMLRLLGVKTLPPEGMPERDIQGVRVYVRPLAPLPTNTRRNVYGRLPRNFQGLRVMAICECGQHLAVGRMHQHKCKAL